RQARDRVEPRHVRSAHGRPAALLSEDRQDHADRGRDRQGHGQALGSTSIIVTSGPGHDAGKTEEAHLVEKARERFSLPSLGGALPERLAGDVGTRRYYRVVTAAR